MFRRYFLGADAGPAAEVLALTPQAVAQAQAVLDIPATEPPGGRTFGLYTAAQKHAISHRARAARRMAPVLQGLGF